jgi:hypothetical protein
MLRYVMLPKQSETIITAPIGCAQGPQLPVCFCP